MEPADRGSIEVSIAAENRRCKPDATVEIRISVKNTGTRTVVMPRSGNRLLFDLRGQSLPRAALPGHPGTAARTTIRRGGGAFGPWGELPLQRIGPKECEEVEFVLPPQCSLSYSAPLDLSKLIHADEVAKFQKLVLVLTYEKDASGRPRAWQGTVRSQPLELDVGTEADR